MAIKGALQTTFAISKTKPGTRDESGYDGLKLRSITPSAITPNSNTLTIPAADFRTLIPGEPVGMSEQGSITGITENTALLNADGSPRYYLAKPASNRIGFADTRDAALIATPTAQGGRGGGSAADLRNIAGSLGTNPRVIVNNFKRCGEAISIGEFGREYQTVRTNNLADGATRKFKGSFDQGTIQADLLFDSDDVGQVLLEEAGDETATYAFHVQLPLVTGTPQEEFYFEGLVTSLKRIVGGPDDAIMLRCTIELDHRSIIEGTV